MEIDGLLVKAASLRCEAEARYLEAGIVPDESILEDRSIFWEKDDSILAPEALEGVPFDRNRDKTLSLYAYSWPPLHVWIGALLVLLYENNLVTGLLVRKDLPSLEVRLSLRAKRILKEWPRGTALPSPQGIAACRGCPYMPWCEPDPELE